MNSIISKLRNLPKETSEPEKQSNLSEHSTPISNNEFDPNARELTAQEKFENLAEEIKENARVKPE